MSAEPQDQEGECNARLFIADNYGDNSATIRCQLAPHHGGLHREQFEREGGLVTITWVTDEREKCDHGCGQWKHTHSDESVACPKNANNHEYSACTYCFPDEEGKTCGACGKTYYYEEGHRQHCTGQPFTCTHCGKNGVGHHTCSRSNEFPDRDDDEFAEDSCSRVPARAAETLEDLE